MPINGWLACRGAQWEQGEVFFVPLPQGEKVALSRWVPRERNPFRVGRHFYGYPGRLHLLRFAPSGRYFLMLADRPTDWEDTFMSHLREAHFSLEGLHLYVADLRERTITRTDLTTYKLMHTHQTYICADWTADDRIVAVFNGNLVLWNPQTNSGDSTAADGIRCLWMHPDRRAFFVYNVEKNRFGFVNIRTIRDIVWLPPLPKGHVLIYDGYRLPKYVYPTREGIVFCTVNTSGRRIGSPEARAAWYKGEVNPPTVWFWQFGKRGYSAVGRLPKNMETAGVATSKDMLVLVETCERFDKSHGWWVPRFESGEPSLLRVGCWELKSGRLRQTTIKIPSSIRPLLSVVTICHPSVPDVLMIFNTKGLAKVGFLNVAKMQMGWVRDLVGDARFAPCAIADWVPQRVVAP